MVLSGDFESFGTMVFFGSHEALGDNFSSGAMKH